MLPSVFMLLGFAASAEGGVIAGPFCTDYGCVFVPGGVFGGYFESSSGPGMVYVPGGFVGEVCT